MGVFEILAVLITLSALFSYVNHRVLKLPTTIGLMIMALGLSLLLIAVGTVWPPVEEEARRLLESIDFDKTLLHGMLGFLLFAGALHVNINDLADQKFVIGVLATVGVITSTFLIGGVMYAVFPMLGIEVSFIYCLLFGSLISPTDPIAVLGILKQIGAPRTLATKIGGESLFNDGVGVVVFIAVLGIATAGHPEEKHEPHHVDAPSAAHVDALHDTATDATQVTHGDAHEAHHAGPVTAGSIAMLFIKEAFGGALFGFAIGYLAYLMLRSVDSYQVEILISLALVAGGYAACTALHISGPIAMVVAGLLIGNQGRAFAMSQSSRQHLDTFWELVDEILNAILFVLIGLEILIITFNGGFVLAGLLAIPITLAARFIAVGIPVTAMKQVRQFTPHAIKLLTWGGLRGGISVALALSIPAGTPEREVILSVTYTVVVFSIVVQGLTIAPLMRMLLPGSSEDDGGDRDVDAGTTGEMPAVDAH